MARLHPPINGVATEAPNDIRKPVFLFIGILGFQPCFPRPRFLLECSADSRITTLTTTTDASSTPDESHPYFLGGSLKLRFHSNVAVEAEMLFRSRGFTSVSTQTNQLASGQLVKANTTNAFLEHLDVRATVSAGLRIKRGWMGVTPGALIASISGWRR